MENIIVKDGDVSITLMVKDELVYQVLVKDSHSQELVDKFCNITKIRIKRGQDLLEIEPVPLGDFLKGMNLSNNAIIEGIALVESWCKELQDASLCIDNACQHWQNLQASQQNILNDVVASLKESIQRFDVASGKN